MNPDITLPKEPKVKTYVAILNQSGTSAPTSIVLQNTIGELTWTRENTGYYKINSAGLLTYDKTYIMLGTPNGEGLWFADDDVDNNYISLETYNTSIIRTDGLLYRTRIEIRVYNI